MKNRIFWEFATLVLLMAVAMFAAVVIWGIIRDLAA